MAAYSRRRSSTSPHCRTFKHALLSKPRLSAHYSRCSLSRICPPHLAHDDEKRRAALSSVPIIKPSISHSVATLPLVHPTTPFSCAASCVWDTSASTRWTCVTAFWAPVVVDGGFSTALFAIDWRRCPMRRGAVHSSQCPSSVVLPSPSSRIPLSCTLLPCVVVPVLFSSMAFGFQCASESCGRFELNHARSHEPIHKEFALLLSSGS